MSPTDFLTLALKLSSVNNEAELRSAVSRAYYSAFHSARLLIESCGVRLPQAATAHEKITNCMQQSRDRGLIAAGSKLNSFRKARNDADYRLDDGRFANPKFAALQLAVAQEILDAISRVETDIAQIRVPIRTYARDIQRLPVSDE